VVKTPQGSRTVPPAPPAPVARAVRVGLLSTVLVGGYWTGVTAWLARASCESTQTNPYGCLGASLLAVLAGIPLLILVMALVLSGRGLVHSAAGGVVSVVCGTAVVYELLDIFDFSGPDDVGWVMTAPAVGLVAAVWAVTVPGRTSARSARRSATRTSSGA